MRQGIPSSLRSIAGRVTVAAALAASVSLISLAAPATASPAAAPEATAAPRPDAPASNRQVPGRVHKVEGKARTGATRPGSARKSSTSEYPLPMPSWSNDMHRNFGVAFTGTNTGVVATHSVNIDGDPHPDDFVYAPTTYPGSGSCIEMVTVYRSGLFISPFDWCGGGWQTGTEVTPSFQTNYIRSSAYSVKIEKTNATTNQWTAYLYNYTTSAWDTFYVSSGTNTSAEGWDIFEVYTWWDPATTEGYYCDNTDGYEFTASDIDLKVGGVWVDASSSNTDQNLFSWGTDGATYGCPDLQFQWNSAASYTVTNPVTAPATCTVDYVPSSWGNGFTANLSLTNSVALSGWSLAFTFAGNQAITNAWNANYQQTGQNVTLTNQTHNGTVAANTPVQFGFQGTYSGTNTDPTTATLTSGGSQYTCSVV
ncbi:cellulose binding domain-containing protein [Luedemannella helvata]|uniref:CBM2 domain-containing protein n=1 Tax=Luedemannella helvata TaxID=349315 RepID=A0ABP4VWL2_9ACTN